MVMPADLNGAGTLFGGRCLAWVDEEAAIYATFQLKTPRMSIDSSRRLPSCFLSTTAPASQIQAQIKRHRDRGWKGILHTSL